MHNRLPIAITVFFVIASCVTFDGEIPVEISVSENSYISPANWDGIKDSVPFALSVPIVPDLYVQGYIIRIHNENGKLVRTITDSAAENPRRSSIYFSKHLSNRALTTANYLAESLIYYIQVHLLDLSMISIELCARGSRNRRVQPSGGEKPQPES